MSDKHELAAFGMLNLLNELKKHFSDEDILKMFNKTVLKKMLKEIERN